MKRFLVYFLVFPLISLMQGCDADDDHYTAIYFDTLEVVEADFPESFELGGVYQIDVTMARPSSCHFFEGFDFYRTGETTTERTIFPIASVFDRNDCTTLTDETITAFFNFEVLYTGTYVFKLYTGTDENGDDEFLIYEVPVVTTR